MIGTVPERYVMFLAVAASPIRLADPCLAEFCVGGNKPRGNLGGGGGAGGGKEGGGAEEGVTAMLKKTSHSGPQGGGRAAPPPPENGSGNTLDLLDKRRARRAIVHVKTRIRAAGGEPAAGHREPPACDR